MESSPGPDLFCPEQMTAFVAYNDFESSPDHESNSGTKGFQNRMSFFHVFGR